MRVEELMTVEVKVCGPGDSLNRAAQIMWENDCGCVPVVDDAGRVVGMLTDRDVCMAAYTQGRLLVEIPVSSAMSKTLVVCGRDDTIATADQRMRQHRVRRLAVVDGYGRIAGILSLSDIARRARRERPSGKKRRELSLEEVGETLGSICERPYSGEASAAEAWVAWTGTRTKRPRRGVAGNEKDEPAASRPGGRPGTLGDKKSARKKRR
jgi:CBS domain-containing protein